MKLCRMDLFKSLNNNDVFQNYLKHSAAQPTGFQTLSIEIRLVLETINLQALRN